MKTAGLPGEGGNRDTPVALCLFALLFSVYLLTFSGIYHSSDEMSMLAATDSLARRGAWDIELLRWMGEQQGSFGPDGILYSRKGIGTTLAALPSYWLATQSGRVGNVQAAMLTNGVLTALTGVLVYLLLRRIGYRRGVSLGVALAFGLGTMAWPYARYLFSETLAGLGLVACAYFLVCYGNPPGEGEGDTAAGNGYLLLAGAGLGVAMLARLNNALAAPFLGLLLLYYLHRRYGWTWRRWLKPVLLFALPVLAALLVSGWYNWLRFGSPLTTGYLPEERFATPFFEGFYGLTFSPGKGLFWYNPLLLAALAAWPFFFRRHRAEALLVAAVVVSNIAFYAPWYLWWAGHAWGPRFLVTILPFAVLALAPALEATGRQPDEQARNGWQAALMVGLILLATTSVAVQVLGVAVDFNLYLEDIFAELGLYHRATLFDPAYSALLRQLDYVQPGSLDLAWVRGGSIDWPALLVVLALVLASALALVAACRGRLSRLVTGALLALLAAGAVVSLHFYAQGDDVTRAARTLVTVEHPGDAAALTEPLLTGAWQDAYDGRLWVWGVPSKEQVAAGQSATWVAGAGDPDPAAARFQVGTVRLDYYAPPGQPFDVSRLPVPPLPEIPQLVVQGRPDSVVELVSSRLDGVRVAPGGTLGLGLYWRALAPMDTSYTVFVQLVDGAGAKAGQVDRLPCKGGCPTTTWRPGDLVGEGYDLAVAKDAPPGQYELIAGMYDLATGENLIWLDAGGNPLGPSLLLGTVDVQP